MGMTRKMTGKNVAKLTAREKTHRIQPMGKAIKTSLETYFSDLNGHDTANVYDMVISEVERPLLEVVMNHTGSNITRAAELLGINRATLRKKLKKHQILQ